MVIIASFAGRVVDRILINVRRPQRARGGKHKATRPRNGRPIGGFSFVTIDVRAQGRLCRRTVYNRRVVRHGATSLACEAFGGSTGVRLSTYWDHGAWHLRV